MTGRTRGLNLPAIAALRQGALLLPFADLSRHPKALSDAAAVRPITKQPEYQSHRPMLPSHQSKTRRFSTQPLPQYEVLLLVIATRLCHSL